MRQVAVGLGEKAEAVLRRLGFAGIDIDLPAALLDACRVETGSFEFDPLSALDWNGRKALERLRSQTRVPIAIVPEFTTDADELVENLADSLTASTTQ